MKILILNINISTEYNKKQRKGGRQNGKVEDNRGNEWV